MIALYVAVCMKGGTLKENIGFNRSAKIRTELLLKYKKVNNDFTSLFKILRPYIFYVMIFFSYFDINNSE